MEDWGPSSALTELWGPFLSLLPEPQFPHLQAGSQCPHPASYRAAKSTDHRVPRLNDSLPVSPEVTTLP